MTPAPPTETLPARLPCPFCGGRTFLGWEPYNSETGINPPETRCWYVRCVSCGAQGPWYKSEGSAVRGWNTRVKEGG